MVIIHPLHQSLQLTRWDKGRFPFNQNVRFEFSPTSGSEWRSIFQNFQKQGNLAKYTQIFESFRGSFLSIQLYSRKARIFGWIVLISEIQLFPEFLETFSGKFCTICRRFQIFESFGWCKAPKSCPKTGTPGFLTIYKNHLAGSLVV